MLLYLIWVEIVLSSRNKKSSESRSKTNSKAAVHTRHHRSDGYKTMKSTRFSVGFRGNSKLGFAFIFMQWFKLEHICIQVTSLHRWDSSKRRGPGPPLFGWLKISQISQWSWGFPWAMRCQGFSPTSLPDLYFFIFLRFFLFFVLWQYFHNFDIFEVFSCVWYFSCFSMFFLFLIFFDYFLISAFW